MPRTRLSRTDRSASILEAAAAVFAASGFGGAKTRDIARAAKVSEALLYRHFPSKRALYQAVLRRLGEAQDANFAALVLPEPSTAGLIDMLRTYLADCLATRPDSRAAVGQRILLLSLAGNGKHARMLYERAQEHALAPLERALRAAKRAGDLEANGIDARNAFAFIEHVGSMLCAARLSGPSVVPYSGSDADLLRQALEFCARGLGLSQRAIARHLAPPRPRRRGESK
jgi:AcrR family transcriptional regulator